MSAYTFPRGSVGNDEKVPQDTEGLPIQFTVSIGGVSRVSKDDNLDAMLILADNAPDEAKKAGRNKIGVA